MATAIVLATAPPFDTEDAEAGMNWRVLVDEDFDTVVGRVWPAQMPSSALEANMNRLFTIGGKRVALQTGAVVAIEENADA